MKSFMDVKSNGVAISFTGANIAVANQFLVALRAIKDVVVPGLHVTSSCTSFSIELEFFLTITQGHTVCIAANMDASSVKLALLCTTYNILIGHV